MKTIELGYAVIEPLQAAKGSAASTVEQAVIEQQRKSVGATYIEILRDERLCAIEHARIETELDAVKDEIERIELQAEQEKHLRLLSNFCKRLIGMWFICPFSVPHRRCSCSHAYTCMPTCHNTRACSRCVLTCMTTWCSRSRSGGPSLSARGIEPSMTI
jgi:hypothetical protein